MLPPEVAARWAAPLGVLCEERGERLGIAVTQRLCGGAKLIDHSRSMAQVDESTVSVRGAAQRRGGVADDGARLGQCSGMTPEGRIFAAIPLSADGESRGGLTP